jgi:hypothetical protein
LILLISFVVFCRRILEVAKEALIATRSIQKANEVELFYVWDCGRERSPVIDIGAFPVTYAAPREEIVTKHMPSTKAMFGKWETLVSVGDVLDSARAVRFLLSDRHASHHWVTSWLLGSPVDLPPPMLQRVTRH